CLLNACLGRRRGPRPRNYGARTSRRLMLRWVVSLRPADSVQTAVAHVPRLSTVNRQTTYGWPGTWGSDRVWRSDGRAITVSPKIGSTMSFYLIRHGSRYSPANVVLPKRSPRPETSRQSEAARRARS